MIYEPSVYVVVLNYNGRDHVKVCLNALINQHYSAFSIIFVDNASDDGSVDWVASQFPDIEVIRNCKNMGWSAGNNIGITAALKRGADYIWILNNDIDIDPYCISELIAYRKKNPAVGILEPFIYHYDDRKRLSNFGGRVDFEKHRVVEYNSPEEFRGTPMRERFVTGCAMLVSRDVFDTIGLIDEKFTHYYEDTDFCCRATKAGFDIEVVQPAIMYHKIGGYFQQSSEGIMRHQYYMLYSSLLFWRKHLGWWIFHREYCAGDLAKWIQHLDEQWEDENTRAKATALLNALWHFICGTIVAKREIVAPSWFCRVVLKRPWLLAELMSFRFWFILKHAVRKCFDGCCH